MPYSEKNAPAGTPRRETIEYLLGKRNKVHSASKETKTLQELSEEERSETNLVELGVRRARIAGDPFGVWCSWAGNVHHGFDIRMFKVMQPLYDELRAASIRDNAGVNAIRSLLEAIPTMPLMEIPKALSVETYQIIRDIPEELMLTFKLGSQSVRLMQCWDLDVADEASYNRSARARSSQKATNAQLPEDPMTPNLTQYIMAQLFMNRSNTGDFSDFKYLQGLRDDENPTPKQTRQRVKAYDKLRMAAQEHFWLHMSSEQREVARKQVAKGPASLLADQPEIKPQLELVRKNWRTAWKSAKKYPDFFRAYVMDQQAASNVWEHIADDVLIVTDKNRQVVFANVESLVQSLFGEHIHEVLVRCLDMWSFFTPLPFPESTRHVVDGYIRKIHPELDPRKATLESLQNAKMAVAHYGCWASQGDPHGRLILKTHNSFRFPLVCDFPPELMDDFSRAALGKAAAMIRFLVKPLDRKYYKDCVEILDNIPDKVKLPVDEPDPFISLFALGVNGYTQRHKDRNDVHGGLAGLCTFGSYTGGNLCIPQLNLKVTYQPGACALIRGTALDHLVADYSGPRFFLIGTNHESVKSSAWRKLGRLPPLPSLASKRKREDNEPPERKRARGSNEGSSHGNSEVDTDGQEHGGSSSGRDSDGDSDDDGGSDGSDYAEIMEYTCVNSGTDDEDNIQYTNKELHQAGALDPSSSESESEDDSE